MPRLKQKWAFVLKISLRDIEPSVWRRIVVPSTIALKKLHEALQIVMGWGNYHLYQFETRDGTFGIPDPDFPYELIDQSRVRLDRLISAPRDRCIYEYDLGDSWRHEIRLERVIEDTKGESRVWCIDGARACPPEDVGGPPGYAHFLAAIQDQNHEEHDDLLEWIGGEFDPESFDLHAINEALTPRLRQKRIEMARSQAAEIVLRRPPFKLPLHESDIPFQNLFQGTDRHICEKALCDVGGRSKIGVGLLELFPGSTTQPAHWHSLEEEHLYVLAGMATLHLGAAEFVLRAGSYVCFPANQPEAHYLHNHTQQMFRYIMIGERIKEDQVVYPVTQ
jgi:uncharacterized cupin superfamily protein